MIDTDPEEDFPTNLKKEPQMTTTVGALAENYTSLAAFYSSLHDALVSAGGGSTVSGSHTLYELADILAPDGVRFTHVDDLARSPHVFLLHGLTGDPVVTCDIREAERHFASLHLSIDGCVQVCEHGDWHPVESLESFKDLV